MNFSLCPKASASRNLHAKPFGVPGGPTQIYSQLLGLSARGGLLRGVYSWSGGERRTGGALLDTWTIIWISTSRRIK